MRYAPFFSGLKNISSLSLWETISKFIGLGDIWMSPPILLLKASGYNTYSTCTLLLYLSIPTMVKRGRRTGAFSKLRRHNQYLNSDQKFKEGSTVACGQTVRITYDDEEYDATVGYLWFTAQKFWIGVCHSAWPFNCLPIGNKSIWGSGMGDLPLRCLNGANPETV